MQCLLNQLKRITKIKNMFLFLKLNLINVKNDPNILCFKPDTAEACSDPNVSIFIVLAYRFITRVTTCGCALLAYIHNTVIFLLSIM